MQPVLPIERVRLHIRRHRHRPVGLADGHLVRLAEIHLWLLREPDLRRGTGEG